MSPSARITPGCAGIWSEQQTAKWQQIVSFAHAHSKAKVCAQIGHAGRKGATCLPWDGGIDEPLPDGAWEIIAPSAIPYLEHSAVPREATVADMDQIVEDFLRATNNAERAGFDMVEVHLAHGYLLSGFISPCTNHRQDEFGGGIENRMRCPLRVVRAVRDVWPAGKPLSVRVSATDWVDGGLPEADMLAAAHYGYTQQHWPQQYLSGKFLAEALAEKENQEMLELRLAAKPPNPSEALAIAIARGEVLQD